MSGVSQESFWLVRVFAASLRLYPRAFRARFGPSMREAFADVLADAAVRGRGRVVRAGVREVFLCAAGGIRERLRPQYRVRSFVPSSRPAGGLLVESSFRDVRFAVRSLLRRPGFAAIAVVTLALGIGANTAIFSVVDGVLLRPLPYADPDGLVVVWRSTVDSPEGRFAMSFPDLDDVGRLPAFETLVGVIMDDNALTNLGEPRMIGGARVTQGLLSTFRLAPLLGRDLNAADGVPGAAPVAVVSYGFWRTSLAGRADVLGSTIELEERPYEIVGVAPAGFEYPRGAQLWRAWVRSEGCARGCHGFRPIGRLAEGAGVAGAQMQASALALRLAEEYPESNLEKRFRVLSLSDETLGDVRTGLWLLLGAVTIVLLIACANVANLLLARAAHRQGEVAVRAALGASRARLIREVLAESFVLALAGVSLGLVVATGLLSGLLRIAPDTMPRLDAIALDARVLVFTLVLSLSVAVAFGLGPALRLARGALRDAAAGAGQRVSRGVGERRYRASLLAGQVALSVLLLVGAGLLLRTFDALVRVPLGFDGRQVIRFDLSLPYARYSELERIDGFFRELETRIGALADVEAVGTAFGAPFTTGSLTANVRIADKPEPAPGEKKDAAMRIVTAGYFETMGIRVLRGRGIEATDRVGTVPVAVVNEAFVRKHFPGEDPLGRRFRLSMDFGFGEPTYEIVGIVGDVRTGTVTAEPRPAAYVPLAYTGVTTMAVHVRGRPGATQLLGQLRAQVAAIDPNLPLASIETVTEAVGRTFAPTRFYLVLIGGFALLAVLLAAVGLYGVVSYDVARSTREIGVRIALGERTAGIMRMVLVAGMRPAALGVVIGLAVAFAGGRMLDSLLFQVQPHDPLTLIAAPVVLLSIVVLASIVPAWRAARVDPVTALRKE